MIVAGCDIGSLTAKAVIMEDDTIIARAVMRVKPKPADSAAAVMDLALNQTGFSLADITYTVGTGYGRSQIPFVNSVASEIACHAKGVNRVNPAARAVIDIGGQDAKAIRIKADGSVERYTYNDKCASGTGRFLEIMAEAMEVPLEEMGAMGERSKEKLTISNQCVIFAETEVVSLINEGREIADIIDALHQAMAKRVAAMAKSIGVTEDIVMTGGVAKNSGVFRAISDALGTTLNASENIDPQLMGALGAALFAREKARADSPAAVCC